MPNLSIAPNERVLFKIHHADEHFVVVEKPPHIVTQPGLAHEDDSLLNGLFAKWGTRMQNLGKERDFGLLHRLDRETSGLVVAALTKSAYDHIRAQFADRRIRKFYWAVTAGRPRAASGIIRKPILEHESRSKKLAKISNAGKPALTAYRVLQTTNLGTLLECRAITGRLHQIRVHLASIGCSILGDGFYAKDSGGPRTRLALHAHRIILEHPVTGAKVDIRSGWPTDLKGLLKTLRLENPRTDAASSAASPKQSKSTKPQPEPAVPTNPDLIEYSDEDLETLDLDTDPDRAGEQGADHDDQDSQDGEE
jgi:23S rRNA pseudouridine1911/1915/1917 synthase